MYKCEIAIKEGYDCKLCCTECDEERVCYNVCEAALEGQSSRCQHLVSEEENEKDTDIIQTKVL